MVLDKPIALTYADARKLLAASKKYPGKLFCRQNRRFEPEFNHVLQIMNSGVLGNIYMIRHSVFSYQRRNDWQTILRFGGGAALKSNVYEVHGDRGSLILPSGSDAQFQFKYLDPNYPLAQIKADPGIPAISLNKWEPYRNRVVKMP